MTKTTTTSSLEEMGNVVNNIAMGPFSKQRGHECHMETNAGKSKLVMEQNANKSNNVVRNDGGYHNGHKVDTATTKVVVHCSLGLGVTIKTREEGVTVNGRGVVPISRDAWEVDEPQQCYCDDHTC